MKELFGVRVSSNINARWNEATKLYDIYHFDEYLASGPTGKLAVVEAIGELRARAANRKAEAIKEAENAALEQRNADDEAITHIANKLGLYEEELLGLVDIIVRRAKDAN